MDIKGDIDSNAVIVGVFSNPLTSVNRPSTQKISKETVAFNDTLDQTDLVDIFRTFIQKKQNMHSFQMHIEHFSG